MVMISCRYLDSNDRTDLSFLNIEWEAVVWTIITSAQKNKDSVDTSPVIRSLGMGKTVNYNNFGVKYKVSVNQGSEYGWVGLEMSGMGVSVGDQPNMRIKRGKGKIIVFHVENEEGRRLSSQIFFCSDDPSLRTQCLFSVLNCLGNNINFDIKLNQIEIPELIKNELKSISMRFENVKKKKKQCCQVQEELF